MGLAQKIVDDYRDFIQTEEGRPSFNQPYNYMSSAGIECERHLYYLRTEGEHRQPFPVSVLRLFREGKEQERRVKRDLMDMGYEWFEDQSPVTIERLALRGKIDGFVRIGGERPLAEVKSLSPFAFQKVDNSEDVKTDEFLSRGIVQLIGYMVALHEPFGIMIYRNRNDGDIKVLEVTPDHDLWSTVEAKMIRVNKAVEAGCAPDKIDGIGRTAVCRRCPFEHICVPDAIPDGGGIMITDEPMVIECLDRLEELRPQAKEYEDLMKWRKGRFKNLDGIVCGQYLIQGKEINAVHKPSPGRTSSYWKTSVTKLNK